MVVLPAFVVVLPRLGGAACGYCWRCRRRRLLLRWLRCLLYLAVLYLPVFSFYITHAACGGNNNKQHYTIQYSLC